MPTCYILENLCSTPSASSCDILHISKSPADADANTNANEIRTQNSTPFLIRWGTKHVICFSLPMILNTLAWYPKWRVYVVSANMCSQ